MLLFGTLIFFVGCSDNDENQRPIVPPDSSIPTTISSYYPNSGGIASKIILHGTNFGTDTSYLKVTVNDKKAAIIGVDGEAIYAIVPARTGTGAVKVHVGKGDNVKVYTYNQEFEYVFRENVTTIAGQNGLDGTDDGIATTAKLRRPWFALTDRDGTLFFIDEGRGVESNGALRKFSPNQNMVSTIMRNSSGPMQSPAALAFNLEQDTLFLLNCLFDSDNMSTKATIAYMTRNEGFSVIKPYVTEPTEHAKATALVVNPKTGDMYFNSQKTGYIYKCNKGQNVYEQLFMVNGSTDTELKMNFNQEGDILYIMVKNKHCIYRSILNKTTNKFEEPTLWVGKWESSGFQNGMGTTVRFDNPSQGTCDEYGNLYIADKNNHCVRKIDQDGLVTTYAGVEKSAGYKDGEPLSAQFTEPESVTRAPDGGLYVTDRGNHVLRKIMVE